MASDPTPELEGEFLSAAEETHDHAEEYLEALVMLELTGRTTVPVGEVARWVKVRPPSAVQMLRRLEQRGHVKYLAREGVRLTAKGRRIGARMVRNGRLMEVFVADKIGMPGELKVAHAAEHAMSDPFADALCTFLGHPGTCPHGYSIPRGKCCPGTD